MHSLVLHCVCNVHFCGCRMTDVIKDGWLSRLHTWMFVCLCIPGEPCSVTVLTGWGVSEHLSQGHLQTQRGLRLSDPCVWPLPGPPPGPASPASAGVCLCKPPRQDSFRSGLYKSSGRHLWHTYTNFWQSAISAQQDSKATRIVQSSSEWV